MNTIRTLQLLYDEDLVESVIFLCASGKRRGVPPLQIRRFHHEREKLYSILDLEERNAAFFRLHTSWLREWKIEKTITDVTGAFPLLAESLKLLAFRKARSKSEEGAELYVNLAGDRHGIVAILAERLGDDASSIPFLNHELMHLLDMVNPGFAYSPEIQLAGRSAPQQRLIRERYRLLWDATIDGRLAASDRPTIASRAQRRSEFDRSFSFWPDLRRQEVFESLWITAIPNHRELLVLADDPHSYSAAPESHAGGTCPLCGFSTFAWGDFHTADPAIIETIKAQFPDWTPETGACNRCLEIYDSAVPLKVPATICL
jgi:hypothetical protein